MALNNNSNNSNHDAVEREVITTMKQINKIQTFKAGFLGATIAETTTLPIDTAKVRMQLDAKNVNKNVFETLRNIYRYEGMSVLMGGLPAGIMRAGTMYAVRLSSYDHTLNIVGENFSKSSYIYSVCVYITYCTFRYDMLFFPTSFINKYNYST